MSAKTSGVRGLVVAMALMVSAQLVEGSKHSGQRTTDYNNGFDGYLPHEVKERKLIMSAGVPTFRGSVGPSMNFAEPIPAPFIAPPPSFAGRTSSFGPGFSGCPPCPRCDGIQQVVAASAVSPWGGMGPSGLVIGASASDAAQAKFDEMKAERGTENIDG